MTLKSHKPQRTENSTYKRQPWFQWMTIDFTKHLSQGSALQLLTPTPKATLVCDRNLVLKQNKNHGTSKAFIETESSFPFSPTFPLADIHHCI